MRIRQLLAATALLATSLAAHADHYVYAVSLQGVYSGGGVEGCFPPDFNQPACPRDGSLTAHLSFDTPASGDGSWTVTGNFGDITNFTVDLGSFNTDMLFGNIDVHDGAPSGWLQASDMSETFSFDWRTRTAAFDYDYGYHAPYGSFRGVMLTVPEPEPAVLMLSGLVVAALSSRRNSKTRAMGAVAP